MGTSSWQSIPYCIDVLMKIAPRRVLDIGVGFGRWGIITREFCDVWFQRVLTDEWAVQIEGIEGFEKNIADYHRAFYNRIHIGDARHFIPRLTGPWDVTIYGDVLEHFEREEAYRLLRTSINYSKYVLLNIPLGDDYPQDALYENEYERHLSTWGEHDFDHLPLVRRAMFRDFQNRPFGSFCFSKHDPAKVGESLFSPHARYGEAATQPSAAHNGEAVAAARAIEQQLRARLAEHEFGLRFLREHSSYRLARRLRSSKVWGAVRKLRTGDAHMATVEALGVPGEGSQGQEVWLVGASRCETEPPVPWEFLDYDRSEWEEKFSDKAPYGKCLMSRGGRLVLPLGEDPKLSFITHPWSGKVRVTFRGRSEEFDLYSPSTGNLTVFPGRSPMAVVEIKPSGLGTSSETVEDVSRGRSGAGVEARRFTEAEEAFIERIREERPAAVAVYCPRWLGISSATRTLFSHTWAFPSTAGEDPFHLEAGVIEHHAEVLAEAGVEHIVFSGGDEANLSLMQALRNRGRDIRFDLLWHGSYVQFCEDYAWKILKLWMNAARRGEVARIGTVKKGMEQFFEASGVSSALVLNFIPGPPQSPPTLPEDGLRHVGMWISGANYRKVPHAMLAALKLVPRVRLHAAGLDRRSREVLDYFEIDTGSIEERPVPHEHLAEAIRKTHASMYVTYSECCPMLPLESLSAGVPCLTGPTSHLFEDDPYLFERLVVPFPDRADVIAEYLERVLAERERIVEAYAAWAPGYEARARASVEAFLGAGETAACR